MDFKDYYQTLGVTKSATDKELKAAFRKLARKLHPDVNPGDKTAESKFKEVNEAYEVLGDPEKRKKYDELGANWRAYEQAGAAGGQGNPFSAGGWNVNYGGGGGGGGTRTVSPEEFEQMFGGGGGGGSFSDFFQTFFGGGGAPGAAGRGSRSRGPRAGRDVEEEIELSLEDAYHGTTQRLSISHGGEAKQVDVRIPSGVGDGSRVRIAGEGEPGSGGGKGGDLYLRIRLAPHPIYERKDKDLYVRAPIALTTAVLGGEADVVTIGGKSLRLKIPAGTQQGQVFRLKGHGMPTVNKPDAAGDLYAKADVALPKDLTTAQKEHFQALAKSGL